MSLRLEAFLEIYKSQRQTLLAFHPLKVWDDCFRIALIKLKFWIPNLNRCSQKRILYSSLNYLGQITQLLLVHSSPLTECLVRAHPVHFDFRLSEPVDCYVNNLENGVILSYINDEIKIVAIQKSVLYNDGNLVIFLSAFFSPKNDRRKRLSPTLFPVLCGCIPGAVPVIWSFPSRLYPFTFADIVID